MEFKTGTLVDFRNRPWVVQQSTNEDIILIKPLGGTDAETVGLYLPLYEGKLNLRSYNSKAPRVSNVLADCLLSRGLIKWFR